MHQHLAIEKFGIIEICNFFKQTKIFQDFNISFHFVSSDSMVFSSAVLAGFVSRILANPDLPKIIKILERKSIVES